MAFGQLDHGGGPQPMHEINVTPLVDVMLVLLVIFIVTAPLITHQIKLNLPKASTQAAAAPRSLVVSLAQDNKLYLDGQLIADDALQQHLQKLVAAAATPVVELRADGGLAYHEVVHLMALIQNAGVTKISLVTAPSTGGASP